MSAAKVKMKREDVPLWKQVKTAAGGYSRFSCSSQTPGVVRQEGAGLHLAHDGWESRGLSQAANWGAWNDRGAAESTNLFITAATALFLSKYRLHVSCLHEEQLLLHLHTEEAHGQNPAASHTFSLPLLLGQQ